MSEDREKRVRDTEIDENLKRVFQAKIDEDVPDRFRMLLDKLREQEGNADDKAGEDEK